MTRWITDVLLHNCPGWDISAPPTQLSPSNFTAGISPIESQVACKGRQVLLSSGNTSSSQCLQNIVSKLRPHLSKMFTSLCFLIWSVLKGLFVCFLYWLFKIYYFPYLKPICMSTAISAIICHHFYYYNKIQILQQKSLRSTFHTPAPYKWKNAAYMMNNMLSYYLWHVNGQMWWYQQDTCRFICSHQLSLSQTAALYTC